MENPNERSAKVQMNKLHVKKKLKQVFFANDVTLANDYIGVTFCAEQKPK